ncbi:glycosyltransferase involved in cell wall biosynthesis [Erwinia toletana]|uniref:Glycosyltransferase involved in cell wall biosynthesis n=1 Tax=Winslowiella toletana TaxID=92490 RepID=A0ABS4P8E8_9GAMM|nr:glycosyltransferase [Winslowiella toletana]MBP2168208.1 glycosyltransferase involved in cell wall biosynthesis [Winslowiella toletana]
MRLSIVIPCYNCAGTILSLLESLWRQRDPLLEVILINDGSSDASERVIKSFIARHQQGNFNLYTTANAGAAAARTRGMMLACGEYLFFCDADDAVAPDFVITVLEQIAQQPDLLYFSSVRVYGKGAQQRISDKICFAEDRVWSDADGFLRWLLDRKAYTAAVWTYVFRRRLAQESDACFTPRKSHEDHLFTLRLIAHAAKIIVISKRLYFQYITEGSLTNSVKDGQYIDDRLSAFQEARKDMVQKFSQQAVALYAEWSVRSLISLCFSNPLAMIDSLLVQRNLYLFIWRDRSHVSRTVKKMMYQRFLR